MTITMKPEVQIDTNYYRVLDIRNLTESTFVLQLPKSRFKFEAGQHISLSIKGDYQSREYSIYSAEEGEHLEILVKEVEGGYFSPKLKHLKKGDMVEIHGPFGKFGLDNPKRDTHKHVFIASGTGIAPFHSMILSNPGLNYQMIHGVRFATEAYERGHYDSDKFVLCTSRDDSGDFQGRVTDYMEQNQFDENTSFYLCGNSDMIFDAMEILKGKGFSRDNVNVEVYF
ncbi:ferredoxin--NADP+ reductase/benzoate/toluate 1,2-dioxygenase reductase subunit [Tangfeifania diversioriginum]|uniref:Ferredoxin--NADP+ reductase/benzoate/toluate 1,2-dioxygenase reductase subunit n=2 Tax=Tangfeifania diversioriginum TaxID=1168035 RepID=A0A1M6GNC9_9BACT|nr:ferredoxin--NADP+ reductase/benzoate/toluate 1,2-dioxygenase reductase subunit [Tangfeifania diversioriginum]